MATEIADAYIALYTKMPGVQKDITTALGGVDTSKAGEGVGKKFSAGIAGVVGGAMASVTTAAMGMISGAIDGAIARVDTMNNFPKIMQNLGYSSEEAASSIESMSDRLSGLPTSLDSMAGMVQQLAPLTGGLGEATDLSLALNNALLAGGKDTQIQANAMEQYTQMLAVGKVDMAAWRSMVSAMPGQMDQLSQSLLGAGAKSMDLYQAMKDGTVGFDQFNAAVLQLNEEGTGAFASFEQQARSSTEGIATSQQNMQTAIVRGLAKVIEAGSPILMTLLDLGTKIANAVFPLIAKGVEWLAGALGGLDVGVFLDLWQNLSPVGIIFQALLPVLPQIMSLFQELGAAIMPIAATLASAFVPIVQMLVPVITQLAQAFIPIVQAILPVLTTLFQALAPIITMVVQAIVPLLEPILALITPLLDLVTSILPLLTEFLGGVIPIIGALVQAIVTFLLPVFQGVVNAITGVLTPAIQMITDVLGGIINFIIGVFTGDWERAWGGIVSIFSGIWEGLVGIVKGIVNGIIDIVNGAIGGINGIADGVSDLTGGAISFAIPTIPKLAEGGIVRAQRGGIVANIGEGRYDEAVLPLSPSVLTALNGGGTNGPLVEVHAGPGMDEAEIGRIAANEVAWSMRRR